MISRRCILNRSSRTAPSDNRSISAECSKSITDRKQAGYIHKFCSHRTAIATIVCLPPGHYGTVGLKGRKRLLGRGDRRDTGQFRFHRRTVTTAIDIIIADNHAYWSVKTNRRTIGSNRRVCRPVGKQLGEIVALRRVEIHIAKCIVAPPSIERTVSMQRGKGSFASNNLGISVPRRVERDIAPGGNRSVRLECRI